MLIPVILSGGAGTRLWPVSRQGYPKPFMRLGNGQSLLGLTLKRALAVADAGEVLTVTSAEYHFLSRDEYGRDPAAAATRLRFLLEPAGRNTAPAIVLAAMDVAARHGEQARLLVLPADHLIQDIDAFVADVGVAAALAADGHLVTFGIRPSHPETGFGYIRAGTGLAGHDGRRIEAFVEKPDLATARDYLSSGDYYWNAGMFCFAAGALLEAAAKVAPNVFGAARACFEASDAAAEPLRFDRERFLAQPDISIDYAIMEKADRGAVVPARFDWSDIGSWKAVSELGEADPRGNRVRGQAILVESERCYVDAGNRVVAAVGVEDLVIVDAGDAILVADRERSQSVRAVVDQLRRDRHNAAQHHLTVHRPWGSLHRSGGCGGLQGKEADGAPRGRAFAAEARAPVRALDRGPGYREGPHRRSRVPARAQPERLHPGRDPAPAGKPDRGGTASDRGAVRRLLRRGRHRPPRGRLRPRGGPLAPGTVPCPARGW
ncbi:MAG: phosphomannose isomerase/mannose-1-phosphate guanylyl transferase [Lysobacteraceae bacterium]|nr:MAG: phosphomannose isomerase/mannose-1-phosphate guanylyl transferase [Xanthomonadaceae bacterium]